MSLEFVKCMKLLIKNLRWNCKPCTVYLMQRLCTKPATAKIKSAVKEVHRSQAFLTVLRNAESFKKYKNDHWWVRCVVQRGQEPARFSLSHLQACVVVSATPSSINDMVLNPKLPPLAWQRDNGSFYCHCASVQMVLRSFKRQFLLLSTWSAPLEELY